MTLRESRLYQGLNITNAESQEGKRCSVNPPHRYELCDCVGVNSYIFIVHKCPFTHIPPFKVDR